MAGVNRLFKALLAKPYLISLGLAGILVVAAGLAFIGFNLPKNSPPAIEIIEPEPANLPEKIFVDVGGAVAQPGIYELKPDSRVNDAVVAAGGLDTEADHDWVSQNLNLAAKITDGGKIYVPFRGEDSVKVGPSQSKGPTFSEMINLNTASLAELDTLWGIGPVTGQKIIDNRPYAKIDELLDKKIVKSNVYEAIKDKITVL